MDCRVISIPAPVLIIKVITLFLLQIQRVHTSFCTEACECVFVNNTSVCLNEDSSVNTTWYKSFGRPILSITCQGTNYTCARIPQFDVNHHQPWVVLNSCSPSVLSCIHGMEQPMAVESLEIHNLTDPGAAGNWAHLDKLWDLWIYLQDSEELPAITFNSLPSLKQLYVHGGSFKPPSDWSSNSTLEILTFSKTRLNDVQSIFKLRKSLKTLYITGNHIMSVNFQTFKDMIFLEDLELRDNIIECVETDLNTDATRSRLKTFKMINNSLATLPNTIFRGYNSLEKIIIENNQIEIKLDTEALSRLSPSVKLLQLINCKIRSLQENVFLGSSNVRNIHVTDNSIETLNPKVFSTTFSVRQMNLSGNGIKSLPDRIFSFMKKLEMLNLNHNNIVKLRSNTFDNNAILKILYLENNKLREMENGIFKNSKFQTLSLASNKLKNIDVLNTKDHPSWSTRELNISNNQIEHFQDWFLTVPTLEYLDLSSNILKSLSSSHIYRSHTLNIVINLRNNNISRVFDDTNGIIEPSAKWKLTLYLSNNPFECDCITTTILHEWNRRKIIADFEELICVNGDRISSIDVYQHCNEIHALIALIGTSVVGTLVGILVLISIVTRWHEMWGYISKNVLNRNSESTLELEMIHDSVSKYDIFVSFAHQDEEFVTEGLLPKLEFEYGQKVCVHYRDWVVGELIPDQIIKSVENSRITIIILTEHFLVSDWSCLEFRTAYNLGVQSGTPKVILILLNESITKDPRLSDDIKSYIAVNSYLVWKDPYFWTKLEKRLYKSGHQLNIYEKLTSRKN